MSTSSLVFGGSILFLFIFSFFVAEITGTTLELLSPITLGVTTGLLGVIIGASNTPVIKGAFMVALFSDIALHFVFSPVPLLVNGLIVVPALLVMGLSMAEIGQG